MDNELKVRTKDDKTSEYKVAFWLEITGKGPYFRYKNGNHVVVSTYAIFSSDKNRLNRLNNGSFRLVAKSNWSTAFQLTVGGPVYYLQSANYEASPSEVESTLRWLGPKEQVDSKQTSLAKIEAMVKVVDKKLDVVIQSQNDATHLKSLETISSYPPDT